MDNTDATPTRTPSYAFVLTLVGVAAVSPLAINMYLPSLPSIAQDLDVDFATVQLTLSLYLAALASGQLVVGPLSDRFGRRSLLLLGMVVFIVGSLMCMLAQDAGTLIAGRIIQAIGGCAGITLSRAIIGDVYEPTRVSAVLGYVTMAMSVAPMLAPTSGGALEALYGWRASFAFLSIFAGLMLLASVVQVGETRPQRPEGASAPWWRGYAELSRSKLAWGYVLAIGFASAAILAFLAGAPYIVIDVLKVGPAAYGLYSAIVPLGYIAGNYLTGRFSRRLGIFSTVCAGSVLIAGAVILMALLAAVGIDHPLALFIPASLITLGNGLVVPAAIAGAVRLQPSAAGAAAGAAGCAQFGFGALVAPISGFFLNGTIWPILTVMAFCAAATLGALLLLRPESL